MRTRPLHRHLIPLSVAILLLCMEGSVSAHSPEAVYSAGWDGEWSFKQEDERCELVSHLLEYGQARFVADAQRGALAFELQAMMDAQDGEQVNVTSVAPDWHPDTPHRSTLQGLLHIQGGGLIGETALARRMLHRLQQGDELHLTGPAWFEKSRVRIVLSPKHLRDASTQFVQCARSSIEVSWAKLSRSRISYPVDEHTLTEAHHRTLDAIVSYVRAMPSITTIFVDGHTDSSGSKVKNYQLSKRRAQGVATYLKAQALNAQIVVRFHGASYPVAANETPAGKAQNRRTTIRLSKQT